MVDFSVCDSILPIDIPMSIYKNVHIGPKIQLGGLNDGFIKKEYHSFIESLVFIPEI